GVLIPIDERKNCTISDTKTAVVPPFWRFLKVFWLKNSLNVVYFPNAKRPPYRTFSYGWPSNPVSGLEPLKRLFLGVKLFEFIANTEFRSVLGNSSEYLSSCFGEEFLRIECFARWLVWLARDLSLAERSGLSSRSE
ncbi:hypothetical protein NY887_00735, partial [Escherichia coli]|uniref:hypothetical protein n=1 Tax=Escherichia coli TaxID=562 RepID=UPI0022F032A3